MLTPSFLVADRIESSDHFHLILSDEKTPHRDVEGKVEKFCVLPVNEAKASDDYDASASIKGFTHGVGGGGLDEYIQTEISENKKPTNRLGEVKPQKYR